MIVMIFRSLVRPIFVILATHRSEKEFIELLVILKHNLSDIKITRSIHTYFKYGENWHDKIEYKYFIRLPTEVEKETEGLEGIQSLNCARLNFNLHQKSLFLLLRKKHFHEIFERLRRLFSQNRKLWKPADIMFMINRQRGRGQLIFRDKASLFHHSRG